MYSDKQVPTRSAVPRLAREPGTRCQGSLLKVVARLYTALPSGLRSGVSSHKQLSRVA